MPFDVPKTEDGSMVVSDPREAVTIALLGGSCQDGVAFSRDQVDAFAKLYGFKKEKRGSIEEAGSFRNLMRLVQRDGLRVMAILARWCEEGQDPVKCLVQLANEAGFDTGSLCEWAADE